MSFLVAVLLALFMVLLRRKLLAFTGRRTGPTLTEHSSPLQTLADLFKVLTGEIFTAPRLSTTVAPASLTPLFTTHLLFSLNFV